MGKLKSDNKNLAIPGNAITQKEMDEMIKKAENGNFHSMEELKHKISGWKLKYEK
jgi:predicted transcriptional regulator